MPAINEYPSKPQDVDQAVQSEREKRSKMIDTAWSYYKGHHRRPLKVKPGERDDNVIINLSRKLINSGTAMLFGQGVRFELDDDELEESPAEAYLAEVWGDAEESGYVDRKRLLLNDIALNGFVSGHPVVKIWPDEQMGARIINLSPKVFSAFWQEDDLDNVLFYTLYWGSDRRQDIVRDGSQWLIRDLSRGRASMWTVDNEQVWPYTWAPIVDWKNLPLPNEYYGLSDLEDADLNDALNLTASNINRILKHHGHPKTIGTGINDAPAETEIESFWTFPSPDAKVFNLEMQSDLVASLNWFQMLRDVFFSQASAVDISTIKDRLGQITNFGLQVIYRDALDRLELKRSLYGEALVTINQRVLELGGYGEGNITRLHWPNPLPMNQGEDTSRVQTQRDMGILSKQGAAAELGIDWATERERIEEEQAAEGDLGTQLLRAFERGQ